MLLVVFLGVVALCSAQTVVPESRKTIFHGRRHVIPEPRQSTTCPRIFQLSTVGQQMPYTSPNFPNNYPVNYDHINCIETGVGNKLHIACHSFNLEFQTNCAWDNLFMSLSGDRTFGDKIKFCGNSFTPQTTTSNQLTIGFHSDPSVVATGFNCTITVIGPPTTTTPPTSTASATPKSCNVMTNFMTQGESFIQSPNYPNNYPNSYDYTWCFSSPAGTKMTLTCNPFDLENQMNCGFDKLAVSPSGDHSFRDERSFCGTTFNPLTSVSNKLSIAFHTDYSIQNRGFQCIVKMADGTGTTTSTPVTGPPPHQTPTSTPACQCGIRNVAPRIVGGVEAKLNEFPWRCYLKSESFSYFCGCTVISPNWVLTASHCAAAIVGETISVVVGAHDRSSTGPNQRSIVVDRQFNHPAYNNKSQDNDISLLHLSSPLVYSRAISPVCLPWYLTTKNFSGTSAVASGWGTNGSGGSTQNILQLVELPVLTTEECRAYYGSAITNNMFCTYQTGKDTCQGDSGGSIDYRDPEKRRYYGIGVVSWGVGCAKSRSPGVYAKVINYLNWILTTTQDETFCIA